jgi:nitrogen fixation protein FixH
MKKSFNPWPLGIVTAFALFLAGTAGLVAMACRQKLDLVSANYYEEELRFQGRIDSRDRARHLIVPAGAAYDPVRERLEISLPPGRGQSRAQVHVHLYRPSEAGLDEQHEVALDSRGGCSLDAAGLRHGLWNVKVSWTIDGLDYFFEQKVVVGSKQPR